MYGGREYSDEAQLYRVLDAVHAMVGISCLIDGAARGADRLGHQWARSRQVAAERYPANWDLDGKAAGPIRNQRMLDVGEPDMAIGFPGGRGTADMTLRARRAGIEVVEIK